MAQPGLLANNQLSDMERATRSRVGVDPRNLGGTEGYGPMPARDPRNLGGAEGYGPMGQARAPRTGMTGIPGYTLPQNPAAQVGTQSIPASGGNMAINTPAAQNRDQMIANQIDLQQLNEMQAHPLYQSFAQSPFGEGDKKYYPVEFFKYLQATGG
jgi:hypothetical protein